MYPNIILIKGGREVLLINLLKATVSYTQLKAPLILTDTIPFKNEPEIYGVID